MMTELQMRPEVNSHIFQVEDNMESRKVFLREIVQ